MKTQPFPLLLRLPYDLRYAIYQHLFPEGEQIYVQAYENGVRIRLPEGGIPTDLLQTCSQLHHEAGGFLYNSYLFNIIGTKNDCLANYKPFLRTLRRHARSEVNINAFSNGDHSSTMCISLQAGDVKMGVLSRRRRGEPKTDQGAAGRAKGVGRVFRLVMRVPHYGFPRGSGQSSGSSTCRARVHTLPGVSKSGARACVKPLTRISSVGRRTEPSCRTERQR